ncbi:hypothetical protein [Mucilaginibacter sp. CSA2-8R]|uniref:hypothetical protein n=1 Tax=Mucilaginibacter sp. CSA2-8R TaxID=3141542 RepID=UPI00315CB7B2
MRRKENEYLITADDEKVSFLKNSSYQWSEIASINSFSEGFGRSRADYVRILLINGKILNIEVANCDYENQDITRKLKEIGKLG